MSIPDDLITPKAAARIAHLSVSTLYRCILDGRLRAWRRASNRYMISRADVEALLVEVRPVEGPAPRDGHAEAVRELRARKLIPPLPG